MSDPTSDPADWGFVTIAEASRRLGISERQARRDAGQLPDNDRHTPDKGPARVRLSALSKLRDAGHDDRQRPDESGHDAGHVADNAGQAPDTWRERAMVAEARAELLAAERDRLADALTREQETTRAALMALSEEQKRAAVLIAAVSTGRIAPADVTPTDTPETPPDAQNQAEAGGKVEPNKLPVDPYANTGVGADEVDLYANTAVSRTAASVTDAVDAPTRPDDAERSRATVGAPETGRSVEEDKSPAPPVTEDVHQRDRAAAARGFAEAEARKAAAIERERRRQMKQQGERPWWRFWGKD